MITHEPPKDKSWKKRLKYRLLSFLPGDKGRYYLRRYSLARKGSVHRAFEQALAEARGKICVDLGANVGVFTRQMAQVASHVYAFEPDAYAVARLREAVGDLDNVTIIEAAAGVEDGETQIYRREGFSDDPELMSQSTSLLADKTGMSTEAHPIKQIDLAAYLQGLKGRIGILKMDIEGGEVALLEKLFDHPVLAQIDTVFVETHETKIPADLARRSVALRRRAKRMDRPMIEMDWN